MKDFIHITLSHVLGYFVASELWRFRTVLGNGAIAVFQWWHPALFVLVLVVYGMVLNDQFTQKVCWSCHRKDREIEELESQGAVLAEAALKEPEKT